MAPAFSTATVFWGTPPTSPTLPWLSMVPVAATVCPPVSEPLVRASITPRVMASPADGPADVGHVDVHREGIGEVDLVLGLDAQVERDASDRRPGRPRCVLQGDGHRDRRAGAPSAHGEGRPSGPEW